MSESPKTEHDFIERSPSTSVAKRLRRIFGYCISFADNKSLHQQWAKIFNVSPLDPSQPQMVSTEVARQLSLVGRQLDHIEHRLRTEHPSLKPGTTSNQIHRLRLLLANFLSNLQAPWSSHKTELTPDLNKCLEFWDELLVYDEYELDPVELGELETLLKEVEAIVEGSSDPVLKQALLQALSYMRRAIKDYALGGEEAFNGAARDAYSVLLKNGDLIRANAETKEVSALAKAWDKFQLVCAPVIFADAFLTAFGRVRTLAAPLLKFIGVSGS